MGMGVAKKLVDVMCTSNNSGIGSKLKMTLVAKQSLQLTVMSKNLMLNLRGLQERIAAICIT
jgi:hypothetical protein